MFFPLRAPNDAPAPAPRPWTLVFVAAAYAFASLLGQLLVTEPGVHLVSPVFPAAGLALAAVASFGPRAAPAVALGSMVANFLMFSPGEPLGKKLLAIIPIGLGAAAGALTGARLWPAKAPSPLAQPRDVARLGVACVTSAFVSAAVGSATLSLAGQAPAMTSGTVALTWWMGDAAGAVIVAPLLLTPRAPPEKRSPFRERLVLVFFFALVSAFVFSPPEAVRNLFLAHLYLPLLAWAAVRVGVRGTIDASGAMAFAATLATALGRGPFAEGDADRNTALLVLQSYLGTVSLTTLMLGAAMQSKREALEALEEARRALEARVAERTGELAKTVDELRIEATQRATADARLHALVEHLPFLVFAADVEGRITLVNEAARRAFGASVGQRIDETPVAPEVLARWAGVTERVLAGELSTHEATYGDRTLFEVLTPIRLDGKVIGIGGAAIDLTEQRRTENALRVSEETYRSIFHGTNDAIFVLDGETGLVVDANRAAGELMGVDAQALRGYSPRASATPDAGYLPEKVDETLRRARAGERQTFEWLATRPDGQRRWLEITLDRANVGGQPRILSVVRDIDERRRMSAERARVQELLRTVLEHAPIILFALDREGRFTLSEGDGLRALGRRPGESIGHSIFTRYAGADRLLEVTRKVLAGEVHSGRIELQILPNVFESHWTPLFDAEGRPDGALVVALDVTERARVEADRERLFANEQRARAAAEEAVRVRDDFLSIASHELRTPLTSLRFAVESLLRLASGTGLAAAPGPFVTQALSAADRQARKLTRLVDLLLDVSRANEGRLELVEEPSDLAQLVQQAAESLASEAALAGSTVTVDAPAPVTFAFDRVRIEQVVTNLLSNALKYGAGQPVEVRVESDGPVARIRVRDRGIGISPEQHEVIFRRFARAVSVRHYGGLGLGLYIVRRIVDAHGGRVTVESRPGQGATFTVELPREAATVAAEA